MINQCLLLQYDNVLVIQFDVNATLQKKDRINLLYNKSTVLHSYSITILTSSALQGKLVIKE